MTQAQQGMTSAGLALFDTADTLDDDGHGFEIVAQPAAARAHTGAPPTVREPLCTTQRDATMPCGSMTNFLAAPLSKSAYPWGASSRGMTVALTAFAICTLSCRMAFIRP